MNHYKKDPIVLLDGAILPTLVTCSPSQGMHPHSHAVYPPLEFPLVVNELHFACL